MLTVVNIITAAVLLVSGMTELPDEQDNSRSRQLGIVAMQQAEYQQAIDFFRRYLKEAADNERPDAYEWLLAAYIRAGDSAAAEKLLAEFKKNLPGISLMRKKLFQADIRLLQQKYQEAANIYDTVLATSVVQGELYFNLLNGFGFALGKLGRWQQAVDIYRLLARAGHGNKWRLRGLRLEIYALLKCHRTAEAEKLLKTLPSGNADDLQTVRLRLLLLLQQKNFTKFTALYNKTIKPLKPQHNAMLYELTMQAATTFSKADQALTAAGLLKDAWKFTANAAERQTTMLRLINCYVRGSNKAAAVKVAEKYIKFYPDAANIVAVRLHLARLLHELGNNSGAEKIYRQLMQDKSVPADRQMTAAVELAAMLAAAKDYSAAGKVLDDIITRPGITEDDRYHGRYLKANLEMLQGNYQQAEAQYRKIAAENQHWRDAARFRQLECLMRQKKFTAALQLADKLPTDGKLSVPLQNIAFFRAVLLLKLGKNSAARTEFVNFAEKYAGNSHAPAALFAAADIAYKAGMYVMAAELFQEFAGKYPRNPAAPEAIYKRLYADYIGGLPENAVKSSNLLLKLYPASEYAVAAAFWQVDWLRQQRQGDKALQLLERLQKIYQQRPEVLARILYEKAAVENSAKNFSAALESLKVIMDKYVTAPVAADACLLKGDILSRLGKFKDAVTAYQRGITLRPASALAIACRGRLGDCNFTMFNQTLEPKYLQQAIKEFKQLLTLQPLSALLREQTLFKLGRSYSLADKNAMALEYYHRALLDYDNNRRANPTLNPIWAVKAAYAALRLYAADETPENIDKSIAIYRQLKSFNLKTGEDFDQKIFDLQTKYQL